MKPTPASGSHPVPAGSPNPPAGVWTPEQQTRCAQVVAEDLATLMRQLAECQSALRDKESTQKNQWRSLLIELLEISDGFERVFARIEPHKAGCTPEVKAWLNTFHLLHRLLWRTLKAQGVTRIQNLDGTYDPHWHLPQTRVYDPTQPEGTILREEKPGYIWLGILLRKAEVAVITHEASQAVSESANDDAADQP